jgi:hypothetical protein
MDDSLTLPEALALLFADERVQDDDGGYSARWARLKMGPFGLAFPNTRGRLRALKLHDLHHVSTGYPTTMRGESEIAAWEIAGSCADHRAAWLLNLLALGTGLFLAPRRCYRAFVRGRQTRNLYTMEYEEALSFGSVGALREFLRLGKEPAAPGVANLPLFLFWAGVGLGLQVLLLAILLAPVGMLIWALA